MSPWSAPDCFLPTSFRFIIHPPTIRWYKAQIRRTVKSNWQTELPSDITKVRSTPPYATPVYRLSLLYSNLNHTTCFGPFFGPSSGVIFFTSITYWGYYWHSRFPWYSMHNVNCLWLNELLWYTHNRMQNHRVNLEICYTHFIVRCWIIRRNFCFCSYLHPIFMPWSHYPS
jgi:hypothetical protein